MSKRRVVITGLGVAAPNGVGIGAFWKTLIEGRSAIRPITRFDASGHKCQFAGEVGDLQLESLIQTPVKLKRLARHTQLALAAFHHALADSQIDLKIFNHLDPLPIFLGISSSAVDVLERGTERNLTKGPSSVSPYLVPSSTPQAVASTLAESIGVPSHTTTFSTACPSGLDAIAAAAGFIRSGKADTAVAGGADSPISPVPMAAFSAAGLVPSQKHDPQRASRPFDLQRESGVISEAAGIVVMETLEGALARGAQIFVEITGYGTHMDTDMHRPGSGLENSMAMAIANSGIRTENVSYICAHGPGHPILDINETRAIKKVFGRRAYFIPVSSIKGVTGNPLAAGGPLQVVASCLAVKNQQIPPTANYEYPDPECDLDYVSEGARKANLTTVLINSHGISGTNSSLVAEQVKDL